MEISSRFVGTPLKPLETQITWRQTTNYAAALGDANPRYLDDERPEGIVAPPHVLCCRDLADLGAHLGIH